MRYQSLVDSRSEYLTDLETKPRGSGDPFHVLAGGRRASFSLKTTTDGDWPVDAPAPSATCCATAPRDLDLIGARQGKQPQTWEPVRLKLLRRTMVGRHRALLLKAADYPYGGVHGGHLAVVWNQADNGYALSMHFAEGSKRTESEREAVLLQAATAMSRFAAPAPAELSGRDGRPTRRLTFGYGVDYGRIALDIRLFPNSATVPVGSVAPLRSETEDLSDVRELEERC